MESTRPKRKVTVSLSGCGFLGIYHIGVVSCLKDLDAHIEIEKFAGASAGAIAAACHLCGVCWGKRGNSHRFIDFFVTVFLEGEATKDVLKTAGAARASPVGPLSPRFDVVKILRKGLMKILPENAHEICNGHLSISLTRCHDGKNVIIDNFVSRADLIQVRSNFVAFRIFLNSEFFFRD